MSVTRCGYEEGCLRTVGLPFKYPQGSDHSFINLSPRPDAVSQLDAIDPYLLGNLLSSNDLSIEQSLVRVLCRIDIHHPDSL